MIVTTAWHYEFMPQYLGCDRSTIENEAAVILEAK